jgi:hypothetical protein
MYISLSLNDVSIIERKLGERSFYSTHGIKIRFDFIFEFRAEIFKILREYTEAIRPLPLLTHTPDAGTSHLQPISPVVLWSGSFPLDLGNKMVIGFPIFGATAPRPPLGEANAAITTFSHTGLHEYFYCRPCNT